MTANAPPRRTARTARRAFGARGRDLGRGNPRARSAPRPATRRPDQSHLHRPRRKRPPRAALHAHHRRRRAWALRDRPALRREDRRRDVHPGPPPAQRLDRETHTARRLWNLGAAERLPLSALELHAQRARAGQHCRRRRRAQSEGRLLHDRRRPGSRLPEPARQQLHLSHELRRPDKATRLVRRLGRPVRPDRLGTADQPRRRARRHVRPPRNRRSRARPP